MKILRSTLVAVLAVGVVAPVVGCAEKPGAKKKEDDKDKDKKKDGKKDEKKKDGEKKDGKKDEKKPS